MDDKAKILHFRGRDLDPALKEELAEYMISRAKYPIETEGLPVTAVSPPNEGEARKAGPRTAPARSAKTFLGR
ncbi:MAG: hypothetical protein BWZ10_00476 [candidate division BRC1 bacterium ADurb.BinA364]|nr:MAG: hypothetical protein BWZ10_00476 [candidate division BRC1 bacterium ADurb.BinA364]